MLSLLSFEPGSTAVISITAEESTSSDGLASCAYARDVTTLCDTNTSIANVDKNLFMFPIVIK